MLTIGLLTLIGCGDSASETPAPSPALDPHTKADPHAAADPQAGSKIERRGKVLETVDASSYTYARLDYCGQEAWVAGPKAALEVGGIVKMPEGIVQTNFESKTLGRTLDTVLFVDWYEMTDETTIDCSHLQKPVTAAAPPPAADEGKPQLHGKVVETMVSGGYTYALVDTCGKQSWAAGQKSVVKVGQWVQSKEAMAMQNFQSKTLGRAFESIWFVNHFDVVPEGPECE